MELAELRESLRKVAPLSPAAGGESARPALPTGFAELDQALAGGFPEGAITELAGPISSGKTAVVLRMAANLTDSQRLVAYIDGSGELYPPAAAATGVDLSRMLIAKPPSGALRDLCRAAEILLRSRSFALIVIDLPGRARLDRAAAQRLRSAACRAKTSVVVLCSKPNAIDTAALRICARRRGDNISLTIHKGSASGGVASAKFRCKRHRLDNNRPGETALPTDRALPGVELVPPPVAASNCQLVPPAATASAIFDESCTQLPTPTVSLAPSLACGGVAP